MQPKYEVECAEERANKQGILAGPFVTGRRVDKLSMFQATKLPEGDNWPILPYMLLFVLLSQI
eukprot:1158392-Pelagomonas_calceolata.AAC.2